MDKHGIRTFFSIDLPVLTLEQIKKELFYLKNSTLRNIKWASSSSMHITIKFIGDFNPEHKSSIQKDLRSHLIKFGEIKLSFGEMSVFPNLRNPRIVWLSLNEHGQLIRLARVVDLITSNYGYLKEKRNFSPHLTIGRVRNNASSRDKELLSQKIANNESMDITPFTTNKLSFIKSSLTPQGPIYSTLFRIPL